MEYFVEEILEHRGNLKKKTEIKFLVSWLGFSVDCSSWEPAPPILNPSKVAKIDSTKASITTHSENAIQYP